MASHLESLIHEYLEWQGYLVRRNVKVGRRSKGGWEMELDLIGYNPLEQHLVHFEPSLDAHSWAMREQRFTKKFASAQKYLFTEIFPWLPPNSKLEQYAVRAPVDTLMPETNLVVFNKAAIESGAPSNSTVKGNVRYSGVRPLR